MNRFVDLKTAAAAALAAAVLAACAPNANDASDASPSPSPSPVATSAGAAAGTAAPRSTALPAAAGTAVVQITPAPYPANGATPQVVITASPVVPAVSAPPVSAPPIRPAASATPSATATPEQTVLELPPNAPPHILKVSINKTDVRSGDVVSGFVQTSSNVASVELRVAGFSLSMPKSSTGRFDLSYTVPSVPFFLRKTYPMEIIARNTRGDAARTSIPITIH